MIRHRPTLALAALAIAGSASAQDPAPERVANGATFGAWRVTCEALAVNETACVLTQRLSTRDGGQFIAELLALPRPDADGGAYIAARVPNGVYFPSGFALRPVTGDGEPEANETRFVWQSCSAQLCEALVELDAAALEVLEGAEGLIAGYRPGLGQEPLVFRLSVAGAAEGVAALSGAGSGNGG